jgi:hypothetical protein
MISALIWALVAFFATAVPPANAGTCQGPREKCVDAKEDLGVPWPLQIYGVNDERGQGPIRAALAQRFNIVVKDNTIYVLAARMGRTIDRNGQVRQMGDVGDIVFPEGTFYVIQTKTEVKSIAASGKSTRTQTQKVFKGWSIAFYAPELKGYGDQESLRLQLNCHELTYDNYTCIVGFVAEGFKVKLPPAKGWNDVPAPK